jgi:hypothetical protein
MNLRSRILVRRGFSHLALDIGLAAALVLALLGVIGLDSFLKPDKTDSAESIVEDVIPEPQQQGRKLRLGVTPEMPEFDDMGSLLDTLGEGYKHVSFPLDDLLDDAKLANYDIIFLTCSGYTSTWLNTRVGTSARGNAVFTRNPQVFAKAKDVLRKFVGQGGTLYASDQHFNLIAETFPEFVDVAISDSGAKQSVQAEVVDPGLRELIGSAIELNFDKPGWRPAAFHGEKTTSYLRGEFQSDSGQQRVAPLLVKLAFQDGNVIFTSFHNEKQHNEIETKLLRYLVFTAVTANVDTQVSNTLMRGGFAPAKKNLFSASSSERSLTRTYNCVKAGDLKFVLGFSGQGARLRLIVTGPDGKVLEKEGTATVTIDVPGAAVGTWNYTVTAVQIPNENFAFTVIVGQK